MNKNLNAVVIFCVATAVFFSATAQDPEQELFNQLYKEIISGSDGKLSTGDTSIGSIVKKGKPGIHRAGQSSGGGVNEELLRQEIDKMVNEAKLRHDDAVKFMLDK